MRPLSKGCTSDVVVLSWRTPPPSRVPVASWRRGQADGNELGWTRLSPADRGHGEGATARGFPRTTLFTPWAARPPFNAALAALAGSAGDDALPLLASGAAPRQADALA